MPEIIKHSVKKNGSKNIKRLVKAASKSANPTFKGDHQNPGQSISDVTAAKPEDMGHFSGLF